MDVLHRSHALRLRRHRSAQDLEVQPLDPQILRQGPKHSVAVVIGVQKATVCVREDERLRHGLLWWDFFALHLPVLQFVRQPVGQMDLGQTPRGFAVRSEFPPVDGFGDR